MTHHAESMADWLEGSGARRAGGSEWIMKCSFCGKGAHLYVNSEPGEDAEGNPLPAGRWQCFHCGERSLNIAKLVVEVEGCDWGEARKMLWHWRVGHIEFKRVTIQQKEAAQQRGAARAEVATDLSHLPSEYEPLWTPQRGWLWPKYLTRRGLDRDLAYKMGLGVCRSGEFADRIILPIVCPSGSSFTARSIKDGVKLRYKAGPNAGRLLYGWQSIEGAKKAMAVEGPFDTLAVIQAGIPCVGLMGMQLRDEQLNMMEASGVAWTVMLDGSPEALASAAKIAKRMPGTRVAYCPPGRKDPGESQPAEIQIAYATSVTADVARLAALGAALKERSTRPAGTLGSTLRHISL